MRMKPPSLGALLFGLIPFIAICFTVSLWDRIYPRILGIPFNLFWLTLWLVLSPLCMWGAYHLESSRSKDHDRSDAP
jgi:hypothetical protein